MNGNDVEYLKIRPYARLLTMLGDQLIKNEIVALTELIKNAYDADAEYCKVNFNMFSENYVNGPQSNIVISDNGYGMSYDVITKHFLNPATAVKTFEGGLRKSKKGRVSQGEKGIGRFSMLKLGKKVVIYSKEEFVADIHKVTFDFSGYSEEFLSDNIIDEIFLDEVNVTYEKVSKEELEHDTIFAKEDHGTEITINNLKGIWDNKKVKDLKADLVKFSPLEVSSFEVTTNQDFTIKIYNNNIEDIYYEDSIQKLKSVIEDKSLYKIRGDYREIDRTIYFNYIEADKDQKSINLPLIEGDITSNEFVNKLHGLSIYRKILKHYFSSDARTVCGDFSFEFYIFDFAANANDPYGLNRAEKEIVKNHRVFLYRDNIRVQPYGAPNDDWLQIDRNRASTRASDMFSNDQIIGQIRISKKHNRNLKDKTSREGIIEDNIAFEQLINIVRTLLSLIRSQLYQQYRTKIDKQREVLIEKNRKVNEEKFDYLENVVINNQKALSALSEIKKSIIVQQNVYEKRLNTAESLAGLGLSVEVASHDIMLTMNRLKDRLGEIRTEFDHPLLIQERLDLIKEEVISAEEMFALIYLKMSDLQQVFVSSKQKAKLILIDDIVKKIQSIYQKQYAKSEISVRYIYKGISPVKAKIIDAVVYQVFINLFDNSLYWLQQVDYQREVVITYNGDEQTILFSDNGIGVSESDAPYIFEPFYSGKGEEGRGLGLYIAKRLLNRSDYDIELISPNTIESYCGANFLISFNTKDREQ